VIEALGVLKGLYPDGELVLLSTCNRVELYVGGMEVEGVPEIVDLERFLSDFHGVGLRTIQTYFQGLEDESAIEHLFSVASSIDSLVVGESQISSQVSNAYETSRSMGFAGSVMHTLFQHANLVSKRVTNETEIHRRRISVPSVAVSEVASEFFERFDDKRVVVIGSGEMGVDTLEYLMDAGAKSIDIVNRSLERAEAVAQRFGVRAAVWEQLDALMVQADMVVSTTGATEPIMTESRFRGIHAKRTRGNLLILDLAVPRDFEAAIGRMPSV